MLQRLFSRGASRGRIENAIEHGAEAEQRDALRERSAMILKRLEHRQVEARRAEQDRKRADRDVAEQWELEAADTAVDAEAPEAMDAGTAVADAEPQMDAPDEAAIAEADGAEVEADYSDSEEAMEFAVAPVSEEMAEEIHEAVMDEAEEAIAADAGHEAVAFRPLEEPEDHAGMVADEAPLDYAEPEVEDAPAEDEAPETGKLAQDVSDTPAGVVEDRASEDLFADSQPLRAAAEFAPSHATLRNEGDGFEREAHHASSLADEDPEAYERLLRKAEEAKARIAKRLQTLKEEEANASASLLDIGAAAPPLAPDHGDED